MNLTDHPVYHVISFFKSLPDVEIDFSIYEYKPQSILDTRQLITIKSSELTPGWVEDQLANLSPNEELAFHSKFKKGRYYHHIPMIDFNCRKESLEQAKSVLNKLLPNYIVTGLVFYESGRSLHAYGSTPIKSGDWVQFMGRLLLANYPHAESMVDSRWIGHRLLAGYSSLRWSANSKQYLKVPTQTTVF